MIRNINAISNILITRTKTPQSKFNISFEGDSFCKAKSKLDETIENAKKRIIDILKDSCSEFGVAISKDGELLYENKGDAHHCSIDSRKIEKDTIIMHGHPEPLPLSTGDVAILLCTPAKSQEAITKDGKYSKLIKNEPLQLQDSYTNVYPQLEKELRLLVLDKLGIEYKTNKDDIIQMFKDYLLNSGFLPENQITEEKIMEEMPKFGISIKNEDIETSKKKLEELLYFQIIMNPKKYDKEHNTIVENYEKINTFLESEDGINCRHEFLEHLASKYNLTYQTNMK